MFSRKDLIHLIWPLMVEQVLAVTIGMADTMMVARVGEAAVSGIALVDSLNILLINIFSALATGGAIVAAQYIGRDDQKNACTAAKQLVYAIAAVSLVIMVLCLFFKNAMLDAIFGNVEPAVMSNARTYFLLSAISYPFLGLFNAGAALFRSMNNSKVSMFTSLLMNAVNIGGNALLIFGFNLGVAGAGISTLCSRALGGILMVVLICNPAHRIHVERIWKPEFHGRMVKNILRVGVPNGLENGMFQIGKILVQGLIATFGTIGITANAVAGNVAMLAVLPGSAIGLGMITVVGQCIGAKRYDEAKHYTALLMKLTYGAVFVLNIVVFCLLEPLVAFYHLSAETHALTVQLMTLHCIASAIIWPMAFVLPNSLRAANDVKFTMVTSVICMWTFRIGLSYVLALFLNMGVMGVWIAMVADWLARAAAFTIRFLRGRWRNRTLID